MANNTTEVVFILDRSGSMSGFEKDTIGGFNSILAKQKKVDGTVYISTVLFDNVSEVIHDRVTIDKIEPLTEKDYQVSGCTALLDAIGGAIHHIKNIHKYARKDDVPEHTIFIITTDGMENASHMYSAKKVKEMIKRQKEKFGWEFIFMAANIDSVETAENIGVSSENAVSYCQDGIGMNAEFIAMSEAILSVRKTGRVCKAWRASLDEDNLRRENKKIN